MSPEVEAARRQDNAPLRWNNVSFGQYNFHFPLAWGVIISQCTNLFQGLVKESAQFSSMEVYHLQMSSQPYVIP